MKLFEVATNRKTMVLRLIGSLLTLDLGADSPISIIMSYENQPNATKLYFGVDMHLDLSTPIDDMSDDPAIKARLAKSGDKRRAKMAADGVKSLLKLAHDPAMKKVGFLGMAHEKGGKIIPSSDLTLDNIYSNPDSTYFVFDSDD